MEFSKYKRNIDYIISRGEEFYKKLNKDKNGRYKSWEYCYSVFYRAHNNKNIKESDLDFLCLNLAFYLASWGMYRGSSFLLQKDYMVHKEVVEEILNEKYNKLWGIKIVEYEKQEIQDLLEELIDRISNFYNGIRFEVNGKIIKKDISLTLVTKVLMGTMGCVPAYDRYFISGIKKYGISPGNYSINSIKKLVEFYSEYADKFEDSRKKMNININGLKLEYPQMKLLDMCFWQIGFDL